jgi:dTDP-4-amino-4,6-dideoxygalactose transaminase
MIPPYQTPYGLREFRASLCGLTRPFPDVGRRWMPALHSADVEVFPTYRGREGQYALLRALKLPSRARVGVPIFTHPVVWQTIAAAGMEPVFIDTDPLTFGVNLVDLRKKRDRLDCLILVHAFGYPADFDQVAAIMRGKPILEDCAHALGSTYRGRPLGSLGDGSFFTFLFSKPLSAGGGGCAATRHSSLAANVAKQLHDGPEETVRHGIGHAVGNLLVSIAYRQPWYRLLTALTYSRFYRRKAGEVPYRVSPALRMCRSDWPVVALQLARWNVDRERNAALWQEVRKRLPDGWYVPPEPEHGEWNHWLLPVCGPTRDATARGIARLRRHGVGARLIYVFSPEGGRAYGYNGDCPEAERLSRSVFLLPAHSRLSRRQCDRMVESIELLNDRGPALRWRSSSLLRPRGA